MNYQKILDEINAEIKNVHAKGKVADYIPELSAVSPNKFGMSLSTIDNKNFFTGDADEEFSIQSISKLFTLTMAINILGDEIWERVGREPSGTAFNSLVQLESEKGIPRNPFINEAEVVADAYFHHCSTSMSCRDLSKACLYLANKGVNPLTNIIITSHLNTKYLNALMLTSGTYDAAGEFAYKVGLPCKSGVGGGIVAIMPGKFSLCVWSPGLNDKGNSSAGYKALELFTTKTNISIF